MFYLKGSKNNGLHPTTFNYIMFYYFINILNRMGENVILGKAEF